MHTTTMQPRHHAQIMILWAMGHEVEESVDGRDWYRAQVHGRAPTWTPAYWYRAVGTDVVSPPVRPPCHEHAARNWCRPCNFAGAPDCTAVCNLRAGG